MKPSLYIIVALGQYLWFALAAKYAIDPGCAAMKLQGGVTINVTPHIEKAMHAALDMAENAWNVMDQQSDDSKVKEIYTILLGNDPAKLARAKDTLGSLKTMGKDPSGLAANNERWRLRRTNDDVEIYCDKGRVIPYTNSRDKKVGTDTSMENSVVSSGYMELWKNFYSLDYDLDPNTKLTMAITTDSDFWNIPEWSDARQLDKTIHKKDIRFTKPRPNLACQIDVSPKYVDIQRRNGWPSLDQSRIDMAMDTEIIKKFMSEGPTGNRTPVDLLPDFAHTLLHELTHTVLGGYLEDIPSKATCYGWKCIQIEKDPQNSDTIAYLGLALKLFKMGYMVNDKGEISKIN